MDTMVLPENSDIQQLAATMVVLAIAASQDVSKHIVQQQVWLVLHANGSNSQMNLLY